MHPLLKIFFVGMLVSFIGTLPLGTLNIAAMQISITEGYTPALFFSFGSLLVEAVYVRLSLVAIGWMQRQRKLFRFFEWITLLIVTALAISSFYAAINPETENNIILSSTIPKFILGAAICAVSPMQIVFWFGWSTVLFAKKILMPQNNHYNSYIAGIAFGTLFGNGVFIFGGQLIADKVIANQDIVNWAIGGIFALTGIIQLWRMLMKKDAVHQMKHPEELTHGIEDKL